MPPITDDVVCGLMDGLARREARARAVLAEALEDAAKGGEATGRVLPFAGQVQAPSGGLRTTAMVASLSEARAARRAVKTVQGIFSYSAGR